MPHVIGRDFDLARPARAGAAHATRTRRRRCRCRRSAARSNSPTRRSAPQSSSCLGGSLPVADSALAAGIAHAYLRGRLERMIVDGVEWVFDVGHNPAAAAQLARFARPAAAGAEHVGRLRRDARQGPRRSRRSRSWRVADGWFVAQASNDRGATGEELAVPAREPRSARRRRGEQRRRPRSNAHARPRRSPTDRVVVYGSFVTVGAATEALRLYCAASPLVDRPATWIRV